MSMTAEISEEFFEAIKLKNFEELQDMFIKYKFDFLDTDLNGNSVLYYAALKKNQELCEILLLCGADMWMITEHGISIYEFVCDISGSLIIHNVFSKYHPGLWKAVETEDIYRVRQLINYWCRTDLTINGITLKDLALSTGHEGIIHLIFGVFESMDLVYLILARNYKAVKFKLEALKKKLRLDFRNMSDHGAPILYYLIQTKHVPLIALFIQHGCQIYTIMQDDNGDDLPVFFSALSPEIPVNVLNALLSKNDAQLEDILYKIVYKGKTVLDVAMERNVKAEVFQLLIDRGGPFLLCDRNQFNQTVQDEASSQNLCAYTSAINESLYSWITNPSKYPGRREKMVLLGWQFDWHKIQKIASNGEDKEILEFIQESNYIQTNLKELNVAVEEGMVEKFLQLKQEKYFRYNWADVIWHGRVMGDGVPLLHKAVLHNHADIVEVILNDKPTKESVDRLFDQHHRTPLHYAFGSSQYKRILKLLLVAGCSEHVLDKNNKEPLDFRIKQDDPLILKMLDRLREKNYFQCEPDPWSSDADENISSLSEIESASCQKVNIHKCCSKQYSDFNKNEDILLHNSLLNSEYLNRKFYSNVQCIIL